MTLITDSDRRSDLFNIQKPKNCILKHALLINKTNKLFWGLTPGQGPEPSTRSTTKDNRYYHGPYSFVAINVLSLITTNQGFFRSLRLYVKGRPVSQTITEV